MRSLLSLSRAGAFAGTLVFGPATAAVAQRATSEIDTTKVIAITPPRTPLPAEDATRNITKFSFIAYGDTRGAFDGSVIQTDHSLVVASMVRAIRARANTPDAIKFVVQSGDAVADGRSIAQLNVSYVPVIEQLTIDGDVPYYLAVGNHDVRASPLLTDTSRIKGLNNYFAANGRLIPNESSRRRLKGYPTYAIGYGNTFVLFFDSIITDDSTQFNWVRQQLEGLDRRRYVNIVVVCHHPAFSSGPHGGAIVETQTAIIRQRYMPLFRKHHVKLMLTGHEHLFEHWVERYSDADGEHRLDQIVTGGGGAPLYGYQGEPDLRQYVAQNAAVKLRMQHLVRPQVDPGANPFHYVIVHVDGPKL